MYNASIFKRIFCEHIHCIWFEANNNMHNLSDDSATNEKFGKWKVCEFNKKNCIQNNLHRYIMRRWLEEKNYKQ